MTNEEWLCRLSTEEKAEGICAFGNECGCCAYNIGSPKCIQEGCVKGIAVWLKQERSEE